MAATAAVAVGGVTMIALPADAATLPFQITGVYYNSPGSDTRSNASLNAEYVKITSKFGRTVDLKGYTLRDNSSHVYTFGSVKVKGHESVWVRTGKGTNTPYTLFWGSGAYIWNNTGDKATLKDAAGKVMDTCSWTNKGSFTSC
ncbi:lamin tail domain-containing protein [Actinoplanes friuliensis]|uniref:LTD domain-containing protein n=1 Tax=Actinoplanes friuliensis DSM 7358 TaxID=1246995 RepID=U5W5P4_9ACTN|nr:lamin tail domain-containing protein [Actinoplanes friuliensis]AGZ43246.1 hypothetical protein AFR_24900 [Actinoplanes friuliensis DSM 7358]